MKVQPEEKYNLLDKGIWNTEFYFPLSKQDSSCLNNQLLSPVGWKKYLLKCVSFHRACRCIYSFCRHLLSICHSTPNCGVSKRVYPSLFETCIRWDISFVTSPRSYTIRDSLKRGGSPSHKLHLFLSTQHIYWTPTMCQPSSQVLKTQNKQDR